MTPNIYLSGFAGSGKTAVGRVLAGRLKRPFLDLDAEIERRSGRTVARLFQKGEPFFRGLESRELRRISGLGGRVVALGGGALLSGENRRVVAACGVLVRLTCAEPELWRRLKAQTAIRPLLSGAEPREALRALVHARRASWPAAQVTVSTTRRSPEAAAALIARGIKRYI